MFEFIRKLKEAEERGKPLLSFEILPPIAGNGLQKVFQLVDELMTLSPAFINITYHRREKRKTSDSTSSSSASVKRPGTIGLCAAIHNRYGIETIPHLICSDHHPEELEDSLIELHYLNIRNILALRGDKRKDEEVFTPKAGGYRYAIDLVKQIKAMNKGIYLGELDHSLDQSNFCVGVAGYPEKHVEAEKYDLDLQYLKEKVDAGADYIVTQMFFDNRHYYSFVEDCRKIGITVPIIPGIKNLTKRKQLPIISKIFGVEMPAQLIKEFDQAQNAEEEELVGRNWAINQCLGLMEFKVPCVHFYTMGRLTSLKKIIAAINISNNRL